MTTTGTMYPLNVTDALIGTAIPASTSTGTTSANGLGFSTLNGKFYYFNKVGTGAAPSPQFVSYDPVTTALVILPAPPATITSSQKIRSGCVNNLGSGYYTINPIFNPTTPALYFYDIATATWTTVTSSFVTPAAVSLNSMFNTLNSGDMAFDGSGNLWILCSNAAQYALYEIAAPVPTGAVASVVAQQIIAPTATPGGVSITGLAFNSTGTLYLSTGAGGGAGNNLLYKIVTLAAGLTLVGTLQLNDVGADLTSCSAPLFVLPVSKLLNFTATLHNDAVALSWTALEDESTNGYEIEFSDDGDHWSLLTVVEKKYAYTSTPAYYNYQYHSYAAGNNFFRIVQSTADGKKNISAIKLINAGKTQPIAVGPNPAKEMIYLFNTNNGTKYLAQVFDRIGRIVYSKNVDQTQQYINISQLPKGSYILKLSSAETGNLLSYQFLKW